LHELWLRFENGLRQGTLRQLSYDTAAKRLDWRKPKADTRDHAGRAFYGQIRPIDIADVFRRFRASAAYYQN
jgi:hypothetical protein